jgi:hypothetical protein
MTSIRVSVFSKHAREYLFAKDASQYGSALSVKSYTSVIFSLSFMYLQVQA